MTEFKTAIDAINDAILKAEDSSKKRNLVFRVSDSEKEEYETYIQELHRAKEFLVSAPRELEDKDKEIEKLRDKTRSDVLGDVDRPLVYKNKVIGKIKNIEYDKTTGLIYQYFEIEDGGSLEEIKERVKID